jgi:hypothetical protein
MLLYQKVFILLITMANSSFEKGIPQAHILKLCLQNRLIHFNIPTTFTFSNKTGNSIQIKTTKIDKQVFKRDFQENTSFEVHLSPKKEVGIKKLNKRGKN